MNRRSNLRKTRRIHPRTLVLPPRTRQGEERFCAIPSRYVFPSLSKFPPKTNFVGTYGCIGRPLAMMNLRSTLARLITTFDIKFAEGEDGSTFDGKSTNHFLWVPGDLFISFTKRG